MAKVGTNPANDKDLKPVAWRVSCVAYDNGRTVGSSVTSWGHIDLVHYRFPYVTTKLNILSREVCQGQLVGPITATTPPGPSPWTSQFTDDTGQNGKDGVDPTRWVPMFNKGIEETARPTKTCAAYAVYPANTWRTVKVTSVDPCFDAGTWELERVDTGESATVFPVLPEESFGKAYYCDVQDKEGVTRTWYDENLQPREEPTWQPYQGAPEEPIPFDCYVSCDYKFGPIIQEGAVSQCDAYEVVQLCVFDGDPLPDLSNQLETVAVFLWDCPDGRTREIYPWQTHLDSIASGTPLDPDVDEYVIPPNGVISNCDGSIYVEPPTPVISDKVQTLVPWEDPCTNGSTYINGRPPASNPWTWGPYTGSNLVDFEASLAAAGYTLNQFGEKHQICPPYGAFGENPNDLLNNGIATFSPVVEPNITPDYVPEDWCAGAQVGCNDGRRDSLLTQIAESVGTKPQVVGPVANCDIDDNVIDQGLWVVFSFCPDTATVYSDQALTTPYEEEIQFLCNGDGSPVTTPVEDPTIFCKTEDSGIGGFQIPDETATAIKIGVNQDNSTVTVSTNALTGDATSDCAAIVAAMNTSTNPVMAAGQPYACTGAVITTASPTITSIDWYRSGGGYVSVPREDAGETTKGKWTQGCLDQQILDQLVLLNTGLNQRILDVVADNLIFEEEDDCWVEAVITDGAAPTIAANTGLHPGTISVTGGTGANGNGRIYTLSWPTPHPSGINFTASILPQDDAGQPDTPIPEYLASTPTSLTYQLPQGDDGASEDDNDFYPHRIKIFGSNQTFVSGINA